MDTVLVVDFGAQYAQLIARRVREAHVYSEIVPHSISAAEIAARRPVGLILSGGPKSVHVEGAPTIDPAVFEAGVPVLGICYGAQLMAATLGGRVERTGRGEYGRTPLSILDSSVLWGPTGRGGTGTTRAGAVHEVWMSHGDSIVEAPEGFRVTASAPDAPVGAMEDPARGLVGVQFHPEVAHTPGGQEMLKAFLFEVCGAHPTWTNSSIIESAVESIRVQVGSSTVLCALSGGVDSAVAAALVHKAVGPQLTCVFVDTGLMRAGEGAQVEETFRGQYHAEVVHVKAAETFLEVLAGVEDPEAKRKAIGETFIRTFEAVAREVFGAGGSGGSSPSRAGAGGSGDSASGGSSPSRAGAGGSGDSASGDVPRYLVQGTLYPDVIESGTDDAAVIKSHHNVGGLPEDMDFELVEPLRALFKDEVRRVGEELGLPEEIVWRQPFPGPGLAVRIIGEVTAERLEILRAADAIVTDEVRRAGLWRELWQSFAVLPAIRSVGVMGDERTYAYPIVIRAVTSEDAMTADWARLPDDLLERLASRIINEVPGINRVAYDITSKPPGTIEWE